MLEARQVRGPQARFRRPPQQVDPRGLRREGLRRRACSVGRVVVDDEDVERGIHREDRARQRRQVRALVVGRDDDERSQQTGSTFWDACRADEKRKRKTKGDAPLAPRAAR